jgi:hypothetical protein
VGCGPGIEGFTVAGSDDVPGLLPHESHDEQVLHVL